MAILFQNRLQEKLKKFCAKTRIYVITFSELDKQCIITHLRSHEENHDNTNKYFEHWKFEWNKTERWKIESVIRMLPKLANNLRKVLKWNISRTISGSMFRKLPKCLFFEVNLILPHYWLSYSDWIVLTGRLFPCFVWIIRCHVTTIRGSVVLVFSQKRVHDVYNKFKWGLCSDLVMPRTRRQEKRMKIEYCHEND